MECIRKRLPFQIIQKQIIQKRDGILGKHMLKTDNSDVERFTGYDFEQSQMSTHRNSSFVNKRTGPEFTKDKNHIDKVKRPKYANHYIFFQIILLNIDRERYIERERER